MKTDKVVEILKFHNFHILIFITRKCFFAILGFLEAQTIKAKLNLKNKK
jgi:hypothetical protein